MKLSCVLVMSLALVAISIRTVQAATLQQLDFSPTAITPDGSVVIGTGIYSDVGVRWTKATGSVVLPVIGNAQNSGAFPKTISANGLVIGGISFFPPPASLNLQAAIWNEVGPPINLGTLSPSDDISEVQGLSADGSVAVGQSDGTIFFNRAFRWTNAGGMVDLSANVAGIRDSQATGVSSDGSVVVGVMSDAEGHQNQAFLWTANEGMTGLGFLNGSLQTNASGISADGTVVVGSASFGIGLSVPFRWTLNGGMSALPILTGSLYSSANGITADGSIIYGSSDSTATFWDTTHGGVQTVASLLTAQGIDMTGWHLQNVTGVAVTGDGVVLVGTGVDEMGHAKEWMATVAAVPEPSGLAIAAIGGVLLLAMNARRKNRQRG